MGVYNTFGDIADLDEVYAKLANIPYDIFDAVTEIFEYLNMDFWYRDPHTLKERYDSFMEQLDEAIEWVKGKG